MTRFDESTASPELRVALEAARRAATLSRDFFASNLAVQTKEDRTPVTEADIACEQAISSVILETFPDHGFMGEESGTRDGDADNVWLVDPIDGTKGFVRETPFFSTQIALMRRGELAIGVSCGTMLDEFAWAEKGHGAWVNGAPATISAIDDPARASISTGNLKSLALSDGWAQLAGIVATADRIRGYGDFYHYHLLASGKIDAVIESDVNILDIAALAVIVTEAGGVFTDLNGSPVGLETKSVLAANSRLHATLLGQLRGYVD